VEEKGEWLPTASTCFNTLRLPAYASEVSLVKRLRAALANSRASASTPSRSELQGTFTTF
jgi:hypothetical protein